MAEVKIGEVAKFFAKPSVAAVVLTAGVLKVGDTIRFHGHTTDFTQTADSMQVNNQPVTEAKAGDDVGILAKERTRSGDVVYKIIPD
jgi:translation elongation factor EF-Tu-like GTPase